MLIFLVDKATPSLLCVSTQYAIEMRVQLKIILVQVLEQLISAKDLKCIKLRAACYNIK